MRAASRTRSLARRRFSSGSGEQDICTSPTVKISDATKRKMDPYKLDVNVRANAPEEVRCLNSVEELRLVTERHSYGNCGTSCSGRSGFTAEISTIRRYRKRFSSASNQVRARKIS